MWYEMRRNEIEKKKIFECLLFDLEKVNTDTKIIFREFPKNMLHA